ncbi:SPOR domain-containing protein [Plantibacter sp. Mn2098]|uniref:SPOR domain-containing protein n=1 Tax=Plantibacter sp. Mn2098 TaxID=3395266 RepID=UPI003BC9B39A
MAQAPSEQYWYNVKTGAVEFGYASPSLDRVGPFETHEAAEHALEKLRANSAKWAAEDAAED